LAAKLDIPKQINNHILKRIFFTKNLISSPPIKKICTFARSKLRKLHKQQLKLIENEEVIFDFRTG
jgi:hypothetical protein